MTMEAHFTPQRCDGSERLGRVWSRPRRRDGDEAAERAAVHTGSGSSVELIVVLTLENLAVQPDC